MSEIYFAKITPVAMYKGSGRKTYSDLRINYAKKYGVINIWRWYCRDKGKFVKVI